MKVFKSEVKQCKNIIIFIPKVLPEMKAMYCSKINENTTLLSNKIYVRTTYSELHIDKFDYLHAIKNNSKRMTNF